MLIPNLNDLMISVSELKKDLSRVINDRLTKVVVKNNTPVSVITPYDEYLLLNKKSQDIQGVLNNIGEDITLANGVQIKVLVETLGEDKSDEVYIKTYVKMKTTGKYKLYYTLRLGYLDISQVLTTEEIIRIYEQSLISNKERDYNKNNEDRTPTEEKK